MRAATAYFVGAGTIIAAIAVGLGGGIVAGNIMNPIAPKQGPDTTRQERRADSAKATSAPSERVEYLTGSQAFGAMIAAPAQARDEANSEIRSEVKSEGTKPSPVQATQANAAPSAGAEEPKQAAPQPVSRQQAATDPASSPENAYAKARDSDVKRAAAERRRSERHERWAERHRYDNRDARAPRDRTDWDDVARNVREDSDAREVVVRPRSGFTLFGPDDDD